MLQPPPVHGAPHQPLPGATYQGLTERLPVFNTEWPSSIPGSLGLMGVGAALALFGPPTHPMRLAATGLVVWGGYRTYKNATGWWPF